MLISVIVAASTNNVIGVRGELPWRLAADLAHFKNVTMGKPVIMGRLTWDSIGRPLPGRQNIVVTRNPDFVADGCDVVASPAAALRAAGNEKEVMVIGGSQIYELFLPKARRLYLTRVHAKIEGDARFPDLHHNDWHLVSRDAHSADAVNDYPFEFRTYERIDRS